ncbi:MAG TPA: hypothetical protein VJ396_09395 [Acidiferrobacterales bacterium]|nr:hypothetical protein [Acidiferrobacterales bacterium]
MGLSWKKLSKRAKLPVPGGTAGKYGAVGKIISALGVGPVLGPINPLSMDPEVLGARAGKSGTRSVDQERDQKALAVAEAAAEAEQARAAAAAEEQRKKDEEAERARAARDALREAQSGGAAANILTGPSGAAGGGASRRLYGS